MLERLARFCYRRRWLVLALWLIAFFGLGFAGSRFAGDTANNFELPASESQQVFTLLEQKFGGFADDGARIVMGSDRGFNDPNVRREVGALLADVRKAPVVVAVSSPYQFGRGGISPDGKVAFAQIQLNVRGPDIDREQVLDLKARVDKASSPDLRAYLGGQVARFASQEESFGPAEGIGFLAAAIILLLTFGSLIAMGLPLMTAIFGLGIGIGLLQLMAHVVDIPQFAPALAGMIGLGVGIDYALFIVTRYRQTLHGGATPEESVVVALTTSGRAVLFAGITVVISLLGLFLIGLKFVQGLAIGASVTVAVVMLASVTLLPSVLGFVGHKIDFLRIPGIHRDESDHRSNVFYRWSRIIQRRPVPAAIAGTAILVAFALPLFSIELGFTDEGNDPKGTSTREAYDLLAEGFGPGFNGQLLLVAEIDSPSQLVGFSRAVAGLQDEPGVAAVRGPFPNRDRSAAIATVFPETSPQSVETRHLIDRLRVELSPGEPDGVPNVLVGGITSLFSDFTEYLQGRLFVFFGAVLVLSFLLLMVVFRSLLIPLKAALVNMLGIGAAYGIVVAVFQWGWLKDVIGVERTGPIEAFLPMMLFAILFGLSMDYEVFLLSRIREEYLKTKRNDIAVADGLAATAGVITAAAAIMVTVFLSFMLGDQREIKLFGLGLAVAIFLDATVIRMVVVPATMELFGEANWWLPGWLDRILPRVSVDAAPAPAEVAPVEIAPVEAEVPAPTSPKRRPTSKAKPKAPARKAKAKPAARKAAAKPKTTAKAKAKPKAKPAPRNRTRPS